MSRNIIEVELLRGGSYTVEDPFIFCAYHKDNYPEGNEDMGPNASLVGRVIGNDFHGVDGWNMYHGDKIPGFPQHPHRGFETVTIVLDGTVDHGDSKGGRGRYAAGDVQWLTAGSGCNHSEMFPLVYEYKKNPTELFQLWLNLPSKDKLVDPHYKMLWREDIPVIKNIDKENKISYVTLIAGNFKSNKSLEPSPNSWAGKKENNVAIMVIKMEEGASIDLPKVSRTLNRNIYFYNGSSIEVDGEVIDKRSRIKLRGEEEISIKNLSGEAYILLIEGEPIGEPVFAHGPFVMNTREEIIETIEEYRKTGFGHWDLGRDDFVNPREHGRYAKYTDGRVEYKERD